MKGPDNMKLPENMVDKEGSKKCPRINQYDIDFLMKMIAGAKRGRRNTYDKFELKAIEDTCYDETSRCYIESSMDMGPVHSAVTSSVDYTSGGVPALAAAIAPPPHLTSH